MAGSSYSVSGPRSMNVSFRQVVRFPSPTFTENLARWLGVVEAMGKQGSAVDEFGEGVMALGRNWQGGEERGSVDIDRPRDRFPREFEVELTNEF